MSQDIQLFGGKHDGGLAKHPGGSKWHHTDGEWYRYTGETDNAGRRIFRLSKEGPDKNGK